MKIGIAIAISILAIGLMLCFFHTYLQLCNAWLQLCIVAQVYKLHSPFHWSLHVHFKVFPEWTYAQKDVYLYRRPFFGFFCLFTYSFKGDWRAESSRLDCPSSKGNHAPHPKFERPNGKNAKFKFFWNRSRIGASSSLERLVKQILRRFDSNQNKWKSMTFLIVLHLKPKMLLY